MSEFFLILAIAFSAVSVIGILLLLVKKSDVDRTQTETLLNLERRLTDLMTGQLKEIRGNVDTTSRALHDQIRSFTEQTTHLSEGLKQIQETVKEVSTFQEYFKSPKLRGQWGEASLEHILGQHYPAELYERQHLFSSGEQVDAVLKLPDGKVLPIDSKFPAENFGRMINTKDEDKRKSLQKDFLDDVKKQIQNIAQKYILPSEGTTDFAILYIPAEVIYYEIINNVGRDFDIANYAWSKKIIVASPNTLYLTLRTIEHWFKDTQISKRTQEILKKLARIYQDAEKLMEEFKKLGVHLQNAKGAYEDSEKRLSLFGERVEKLIETGEKKELEEEKK